MGTDVYEKSNLALKVRNFRMVFKQLFRDLPAYPPFVSHKGRYVIGTYDSKLPILAVSFDRRQLFLPVDGNYFCRCVVFSSSFFSSWTKSPKVTLFLGPSP